MSEAGNFDNYIKGKFSNFSPEVPSHVWAKIIAERERRKPKGFWLNFLTRKNILLLAGLLLAGGTGTWLINTNQTIQKTGAVDNITSTSKPGGQQKTVLIKTENNRIMNGNQIAGNDLKNLPKNSEGTQNAGVKSNEATSTVAAKSGLDADLPASISITTPTDTYNPPGIAVYTKKSRVLKNITRISSHEADAVVQEDVTDVDEKTIDNDIQPGGSLLGRLLFGAQNLSEREQLTGELKTRNFPNVALPECPTFEKDAAGNKKYFELYAGPDYAARIMTDTPNSVYLLKRKESTSFTSAFSAGIRYTRVFKNCMSVRAGLNFSQINEKFTFVQGNVIQVTYIIDPATGDTTAAYTVRGSQHKITRNRYKTIDIPILLGYEFGYGRVHANINAGTIVNVYSWQRGEVLDTTDHPVSITTGKGSPSYQYKTNLGVSLTGGLSIYYKLNDVLHLLAEPYLRYNLSSMSKEDDYLTLRQKFTTIGLRLGVRLDIK